MHFVLVRLGITFVTAFFLRLFSLRHGPSSRLFADLTSLRMEEVLHCILRLSLFSCSNSLRLGHLAFTGGRSSSLAYCSSLLNGGILSDSCSIILPFCGEFFRLFSSSLCTCLRTKCADSSIAIIFRERCSSRHCFLRKRSPSNAIGAFISSYHECNTNVGLVRLRRTKPHYSHQPSFSRNVS